MTSAPALAAGLIRPRMLPQGPAGAMQGKRYGGPGSRADAAAVVKLAAFDQYRAVSFRAGVNDE